MKKLIFILFALATTSVFAQPMLVTKTVVTPDPAWQVLKNNFSPLSDYLSQQISVETNSIREKELIIVKRKIWNAIRDFRNATLDSVAKVTEVDSLQTITLIARNKAEIKVLKARLLSCAECDADVLNSMINTLQNQQNEATKNSKNWVKKKIESHEFK